MKKVILSVFSISVFGWTTAQEEIVSMGAGYANHIWYSFNDGQTGTSAKGNWELAFEMKNFGVGVHANRAVDMEVWKCPEMDVEIDTQIDTNGMSATWPQVFNDDESWGLGAFNQLPTGTFNYGWGTYNVVNHQVIGSTLYVIKLPNGTFKKFFIESKIMGVYTFQLANLDNTEIIERTISNAQGLADNSLMAYYSISNDEFLNREPNQTAWDILFTQYNSVTFGNAQNQRVVGVLMNENTQAVKISLNNSTDSYTYSDDDMSDLINTVGYDWKELNYQTFQWFIHDTLVYVVKTQSGDYWELAFTSFSGQSTGNIGIRKLKLQSAGLDTETASFLQVYPNPSKGQIHVLTDIQGSFEMRLVDMSGRTIWNNTNQGSGVLQTLPLDFGSLNLDGIYVLQIIDEKGNSRMEKLMIVK
jgi:hypothetical protein